MSETILRSAAAPTQADTKQMLVNEYKVMSLNAEIEIRRLSSAGSADSRT